MWFVSAGLVVLQVPVVLSQGPWAGFRIAGRDVFWLVDFVPGNLLLPLGGLLMCLYAAWGHGFQRFRAEANEGTGRLSVPMVWHPLFRFVLPGLRVAILLSGLGG